MIENFVFSGTTTKQKIQVRAIINKWVSDTFPILRRYISHTSPKKNGTGWVVDLLAREFDDKILGSLKINNNFYVKEKPSASTIAKNLNKLIKKNGPDVITIPDTSIGKYHKFVQGDGIEAAQGMQGKSIDLLLTDPPYGISNPYTCEKQVSRRLRKNGSDFIMPKGHFGNWDYDFSPSEWTEIILPKVRGWAVIFCAQAQIGEYTDILKSHRFNSVGTFV